MNEKDFRNTVKKITMPKQMADTLIRNCINPAHTGKTGVVPLKRPMLTAAALMAALLVGIGSTSYAAYNLYQIKTLNVFFDSDITQREINEIGREISRLPGIDSVRFISADEAWNTFQETYLKDIDELTAQFTENPLKDSCNYRVTVKLNADTDAIRSRIETLTGVRLVSNLKETE